MARNLADLQAECAQLGLVVESNGRPNKAQWIAALRDHHWSREHPGEPLPEQVSPMLLSDWEKLDEPAAREIEDDHSQWIVQPKRDGVRALLHVNGGSVRVTGRCVSDVTYRYTEHQEQLPHLTEGFGAVPDTVLDGELVCPTDRVDTGSLVTTAPLQAATAILGTSPANAERIQRSQQCHLWLHVFDILRYLGRDTTELPLAERLDLLAQAVSRVNNSYVELVPSYAVNKSAVHANILAQGGEGTVWKRLDQPYEVGRRVSHWVKRKRSLKVEAFVSGFKPGNSEGGHRNLVGALEFSVVDQHGHPTPVAWASNLSDAERATMTDRDSLGNPRLRPQILGRRAMLTAQDVAGRSRRLRHARISQWL